MLLLWTETPGGDLVAELVVLLLWVRYQVTLVVLQVDALTYSS